MAFSVTPKSFLLPFSSIGFDGSWKKRHQEADYFYSNTVNFMFFISLDLTPPYSCLFSCSSPSEIWLKNIYIVHHPRNTEEKRNLKHGSFVCSVKPPWMMMQLSRKSKLLLWYVDFNSSKDSDWHPVHTLKFSKFLLYEDKVGWVELVYRWSGALIMSSCCLPKTECKFTLPLPQIYCNHC